MNANHKRWMKPLDCEKHTERLKQIVKKLTPDEVNLISQVTGRDPLSGLYPWAMLVYTLCMVLILFWPFDLSFTRPDNHVKWSKTPPGVELAQGQIISPSPSPALFESLVTGSGMAIEVWIQPADNQQRGPARILSYSINPYLRNFTLAQQKADLQVRLRTERTNLNGTNQMLTVHNVFSQAKPIHLIVSYDFKVQNVFVDGSLKANSPMPGGHFKNWNPDYRLILGNEATGNRPWSGTIAYVAIYNQPLDARDARQHYLDVKAWIAGADKFAAPLNAPVVQYLFDEKKGNHIANSGTLSPRLSLEIPKKIETAKRPFLAPTPHRRVRLDSYAGYEMILNVFLFIPFAFLLHGLFTTRINGFWKPIITVIAVGGITTLSVEMLQYFFQSRNSSLTDVATNLLGVLIGVWMKAFYDILLKHNSALIFKHLSPVHPSIGSTATRSTPE